MLSLSDYNGNDFTIKMPWNAHDLTIKKSLGNCFTLNALQI